MEEAVANLLKIDLGALACFSNDMVLNVSPPRDLFLLTGEKGYTY